MWWVRAYIYRYLINNWRLVKIGTTQAQRKLFFNLRKETDRLEREGFKPQPQLIAHRMGVRESDVREMQERMGQSEVSLDQPTGGGEDNDTRLLDVIPDAGHNPETETADREWRDFAHDKVERVRDDARGQGAGDFQGAAAGGGSRDAAGDRRALRNQPRARASDRDAAQAAAEGVYRGVGAATSRAAPVRRE